MSVWFITGGRRGLGRHLVNQLLAKGHQVATVSRSVEQHSDENLLQLQADVTDQQQVTKAISQTLEKFGRIDRVVNNAGVGLLGAIEEADEVEARKIFDLNVHGVLNVLRAILPIFRKQGNGTIINISSLAGLSGAASWGVYSASKFAVEGLSEALAKEVGVLGIRVVLVEPGILRTDFLQPEHLVVSQKDIRCYSASVGQARQNLADSQNKQPGDPEKAALAIIAQVEADAAELGVAQRLALGADAKRVFTAKVELLQQQLAHNIGQQISIEFEESR